MATITKRVRERSGKEPLVTWQAWYTDQNGKRRNKTFAKQKDARAWLDRTVIEVADGVHTPSSDSITVAEAGELWITQGRTDGLEPRPWRSTAHTLTCTSSRSSAASSSPN